MRFNAMLENNVKRTLSTKRFFTTEVTEVTEKNIFLFTAGIRAGQASRTQKTLCPLW